MMGKLSSVISMAERTFGMIRCCITERSEFLYGLTICPAWSVYRTVHLMSKEPSAYHSYLPATTS